MCVRKITPKRTKIEVQNLIYSPYTKVTDVYQIWIQLRQAEVPISVRLSLCPR